MNDGQSSGAARSYVLFILLVVYVFNFVDRQILAILIEPIRKELQIPDWQMGIIGGFGFALLYTTLGIPLAWAADRFNRVWIVSGSLTVWSAFTVLCGMAQNALQLLIARIGVGVGEAGGSPPSQSIISDLYPPSQRASALGVWSLGIPIGSALGILGGAWIAQHYGWRAAFFAAGAPGILLALIMVLTIKEPKRGGMDAAPAAGAKLPTIGETFAAILSKPTFWYLALGASVASFVGYATFFWGPTYFVRAFGLTPLEVSYFAAIIIGGAASAGSIFGGRLVDALGKKNPAMYALIPAGALLIAMPLNIAGVLAPDPIVAGFILLLPALLGAMWYGPLFGVVQNLVEPRMRAMAVAILFFIINLIGLGGGPTVTGALSSYFQAQYGLAGGLKWSLVAVICFTVLAALLMALAATTIKKDMTAQPAAKS